MAQDKKDFPFWDLYARCYDSIYHLMPYRKLLWDTLQALDLKSGMKILDAGCGTGNFELFASGKNIPPVEIEATDFSPLMLSRAIKKCKHLSYINFRRADLNSTLDYPDDSFDRIVCINVLYALENPAATLQELLRILRPAGSIIVANPRPNAHAIPLIQEHFGRINNIRGLARKSMVLLKTLIMIPTTGLAPLLFNLFVIEKKGEKQTYHFMPEAELTALFQDGGFQDISVVPTYADQDWFVTANWMLEQNQTRKQLFETDVTNAG